MENKYEGTIDSITTRWHAHHKLGNVDSTQDGLPVGAGKKRNGTGEGVVLCIRDIAAK